MPDTLRYSCIEFFLVCFKMLRCFSFHSNSLVVFAEHHGVSSHVVVTRRGRRVGIVDLERGSRTDQRARLVGRHYKRYRRNVNTSYAVYLASIYSWYMPTNRVVVFLCDIDDLYVLVHVRNLA